MSDAELLHRLQQMEKEWQAAPVTSNYDDELDGIEDGEGYQGRVEAFDMFAGKKDPSALYLKTAISIQNHSEHGGRQLSRLDNVMDAEKLKYLKEFLHKLGVDVENTPLAEFRPGTDTLNGILDTFFVFDIYTNKKGYRNWAVRQRLDDGDFGTGQEQIDGFEQNVDPKKAKPSKSKATKVEKPENCICEDPQNGQFNEDCPIAGHGTFDF